MKFHYIHPIKILESSSRRWITDDIGFNVVEDLYVNYPKADNRWAEFSNRVIRKIPIDFGGMISLDEPKVSVKLGLNNLVMLVTHLPHLVETLTMDRYCKEHKNFGLIWSFAMYPYLSTAIHQSTRDAILAKAEPLLKNCEEMIEGSCRDFDEKIAKINKDAGKEIVIAHKRLTEKPDV